MTKTFRLLFTIVKSHWTKQKISYEAIELHCLKHNSPKTGWTKYNIFLSVIWKEYALARMNKVRHACSRKSKHEWILFYEFYEWIIMKYDMNLQRFIITEYEYYMINECEKFESQHKNSWSNNSTTKTLCQFHKNCKEQKFKNTMFYIIHYKLLKSLLKILSTVFIE